MNRNDQIASMIEHLEAALACADAMEEFHLAALIAQALHDASERSRT